MITGPILKAIMLAVCVNHLLQVRPREEVLQYWAGAS